jgi:selenocysteine-specific elongation factor
MIPVSSLTGEGIEELRSAIAEAIASAAPRTPRTGPPRLSVDRSFAAKGFGSVVTGTLIGGAFSVGDTVEIQPLGRRCRIRGLQSHGVSVDTCEPGLRCALNLQGVELEEISRGQAISAPAALGTTLTADVKLWWLGTAPAIEEQAAIEFLSGTAERRARLAPIGDSCFQPGCAGYARLHIDGDPVPLAPGDRFIARGFARNELAGSTVGGGIVLDVAPPHRRRSDPALASDLAELESGDASSAIVVRVRRSGFGGFEAEPLRREAGLPASSFDAALAELVGKDQIASTSSQRWLHRDALEDLGRRLLAGLGEFHDAEPIRPGMPIGALRGSLPENVARDSAELAMSRLADRGQLVVESDLARLPDHRPTLDAADQALVERIVTEARVAALEPPSLRDWESRLGVGAEHLKDLLAHLVRIGELVRAPGELWFERGAVDALREKIAAHLREHSRLETPDYKALIGTSRRTAVPLMELFDQEHFTVRSGDARVLRRN